MEKHLLQLKTLPKGMTGEEIARELISVQSTCFSIGSDQLIVEMGATGSVNNVAIRNSEILYPHMLDVGCFLSHVWSCGTTLHYSHTFSVCF